MRVVIDSNGAGADHVVFPVAISTVRIELVPSRKRCEYGFTVAMATVLPSLDYDGRPGKIVAGASCLTSPLSTLANRVAPV